MFRMCTLLFRGRLHVYSGTLYLIFSFLIVRGTTSHFEFPDVIRKSWKARAAHDGTVTLTLALCDTRPVFVLCLLPPSAVSGRRAAVGQRVAGVGVYPACLAPACPPHGRRGQQPELQSAPTGPAAQAPLLSRRPDPVSRRLVVLRCDQKRELSPGYLHVQGQNPILCGQTQRDLQPGEIQ